MALDRLAVLLKIGDQLSPFGVKDGMPICYIDEAETGIPLEKSIGPNNHRVFAVMQVKRSLLPKIKASLLPLNPGDTDGGMVPKDFKPRSSIIELSALEKTLSIDNLVADLSSKSIQVPLINGTELSDTIFKDVREITAEPKIDINAVASGSFTVGAAGIYATFALLSADLAATFTGALTGTLISNVTETAQSLPISDQAGYKLLFTSNSPHDGDPTAGWQVNWNFDSTLFSLRGINGTDEICNLRIKLVAALTNAFSALFHAGAGNVLVHDCMVDHDGGRGRSVATITVGSAKVWNIVGWNNITDAYCKIFTASTSIINNCVFYSGAIGLDANSVDNTIKNVACYGNTTNFLNIGAATGNNNASDDATAGDGNWNSGSGNIINRVAATDFINVDDANSSFLDIDVTGGLDDAGTVTILAENTAGIRTRSRPNATTAVSIGASERAGTVATPTISPDGGIFDTTQSVTLATATTGAQTYYTEDGNDPTNGDTAYAAPFDITITEQIKALATKAGSADSAIASAIFTEGTFELGDQPQGLTVNDPSYTPDRVAGLFITNQV